MEWTKQEAEQVELQIKKRAISDPAFRTLALTQPLAAVKAVTQHPLPEGFKLRIVEAAGANHTIVLPDVVPNVEELSDAELEAVAGGSRNNNNNVTPKLL